jgi:hypothetical protein
MKITKDQLKSLIREEIEVINENQEWQVAITMAKTLLTSFSRAGGKRKEAAESIQIIVENLAGKDVGEKFGQLMSIKIDLGDREQN